MEGVGSMEITVESCGIRALDSKPSTYKNCKVEITLENSFYPS